MKLFNSHRKRGITVILATICAISAFGGTAFAAQTTHTASVAKVHIGTAVVIHSTAPRGTHFRISENHHDLAFNQAILRTVRLDASWFVPFGHRRPLGGMNIRISCAAHHGWTCIHSNGGFSHHVVARHRFRRKLIGWFDFVNKYGQHKVTKVCDEWSTYKLAAWSCAGVPIPIGPLSRS